ncbi:MAG: hypothetical protein PGN11_15750 [Quadrisphaera sp.]
MDAAHHPPRAQGLRGAAGREAPARRRARGCTATAARGASAARDSLEGWGKDRQPHVLVIGGGQGGIALGARLRQLDVPALVVDAHERPGDQWRGRYKSLCLHDPVWYDHLPYLPFPRNWPVFAPKDKIGDWLEMYVRVMEVDYWGSTRVTSAARDEGDRHLGGAARAPAPRR